MSTWNTEEFLDIFIIVLTIHVYWFTDVSVWYWSHLLDIINDITSILGQIVLELKRSASLLIGLNFEELLLISLKLCILRNRLSPEVVEVYLELGISPQIGSYSVGFVGARVHSSFLVESFQTHLSCVVEYRRGLRRIVLGLLWDIWRHLLSV